MQSRDHEKKSSSSHNESVNFLKFQPNLECVSDFWERSQNCEKQILASSCLSLRLSELNNSGPTGRIFINLILEYFFFKNPSRRLKLH